MILILSTSRCNFGEIFLGEAKRKRGTLVESLQSIFGPISHWKWENNISIRNENGVGYSQYRMVTIQNFVFDIPYSTSRKFATSGDLYFIVYESITRILLPKVSPLCLCFSSSSIISWTDLLPPKVEIIWGKSNFRWGSDSGLLLNFANNTLISSCGSWELYQQTNFSG